MAHCAHMLTMSNLRGLPRFRERQCPMCADTGVLEGPSTFRVVGCGSRHATQSACGRILTSFHGMVRHAWPALYTCALSTQNISGAIHLGSCKLPCSWSRCCWLRHGFHQEHQLVPLAGITVISIVPPFTFAFCVFIHVNNGQRSCGRAGLRIPMFSAHAGTTTLASCHWCTVSGQ
jgi:hypothetical protein